MKFRDRANAIGTKELILVKHFRKNPAKPFRVNKCKYSPFGYTKMPGPVGWMVSMSSGIRRNTFLSSRPMRSEQAPAAIFRSLW